MSARNNPRYKASLEALAIHMPATATTAPIAFPKVMEWAKEAAEETRAFYDKHEDCEPPSWLPELEAALADAKAVASGEVTINQLVCWTVNGKLRLPDSDTTVLMATADGEVDSGFYDSENEVWRWANGSLPDSIVTAWADMPEAPAL